MQQYSISIRGSRIDSPLPQVSQVHVEDVAHRLSNICRFGGRTREFFSVAQHSVECCALARELAPEWGVDPAVAARSALLHDGEEYVLGDVISPVRHELGEQMRSVSRAATAVVDQALGVSQSPAVRRLVEWVDDEMLVSDAARWDAFGCLRARRSITGHVMVTERNSVPHPYQIRFAEHSAWSPRDARDRFLEEYHRLSPA